MRKLTDGRLAVAALIAFAFWVFVALPLYYGPRDDATAHKCSDHEEKNYGFWEKTRCDPVAFFTAWLVGFTGVLAVSTIGLWIVTWRSGSKQSRDMQASLAIAERSLTELEAPFVALKITESGIIRKYNEMGHDFQTIKFCITNHGRTPAQLIELTDLLALRPKSDGLPPEVDPDTASRSTMPYGVIAPPNNESQPFSNNLFAFMLGKLTTDQLPLKENGVFFYGFVRYTTIFNEIFRVGFCYHFDLFSEKWLLTGGEKYNYCKKERRITLPNGFEVYRGYDTDNIPPYLRKAYPRRLAEALRALRDADN